MGEAVITDQFRQRLAKRFVGGVEPLPKIFYVAFGDGGHNADNTLKAIDRSRVALSHELTRKQVSSVTQEDFFSVTGTGILDKADLVGAKISEAGLLDSSGKLLGYKHFGPHPKENDEEYDVAVKLKF